MSYTIDLTTTNSYNETLTLSGSGDILLDVNQGQLYRIDVDYSDSYIDLYPNDNWNDFAYYFNDSSDYSYILFADTNEYDINYYTYTDDSNEIDVTFNIETVDKSSDDYSDFMSDAYELNLDENNQVSINGNIDGIDRDFFKVELEANKMYEISVSTQNVDNPLDDSMVYLFDANGNEVAMDDDGGEGLDSDLVFQPTESGEYYIEVKPFSYGQDGNYQLSISEVDIQDDAPNTISDNDPVIKVGSTITGSIDYSSDEDYYRFDTENEQYYTLTIAPTNEDNYNSFYANIYDQNGNWVYTDYSWNDNSVTIGFEGDGNTYYIDVQGWERGEYTLTLNETEIISDGNDSPSEAVQLTENEIENGTIDSVFDEDYYAINVEAGQSYVIDVYTNDGYTWADIVDSNNNYIFDGVEYNYSYDYNNNEMIFTPNESGTYYIRIDGDNGSHYSVSYFENSDDYSNTIYGDNIGEINFDDNNNASITGRLETNYDTDVFRLDATTNNIYDITLTSDNGADGYINVVDSDGNYVYTDYVYNYDYSILDEDIFQPTNDGTYYIEVVGFDTGSYTLNITKSSNTDDHPDSVYDNFSDDSILSDDVTTQNGEINSNVDSDYFELNLTAGQTYEIDLSGSNGWGYLDIVDSNGNYLWDNVYWNYDSTYDDSLYFTPTDDEIYYVRVDGSNGYNYQVSISSITNSDDYGNSINGDNIGKLDENNDVSGNIDYSYDDDLFEIDTQAGDTYQIIISSENYDVWGDILDSNGYYLDWNNISYDWNWDYETNTYQNILTFTANSNEYYLDVSGYDSNSSYTITLRNISTDNDDNEGNNINTAVEANEGENSGSIDYYGDVDYFAINLDEGNIYTINLSGLDYGYLDIVDSNGNYLWENVYWNYDPNYDDSLTITPSESGTYYVIVHGDIGNYSLDIDKQEMQQDDYGNSFDDATMIDSNEISGNLTQFDYDMFEYNFDANNTYTITLTPDSDNLSLYLDLYDSNENYIWNYNYSWNSDGSVTITFTPRESGEYYLGVSGYGSGDYTVSIEENNTTTNDVSADTSTTAQITLTNNSGNYNGELEYYGDEDWIKVNLDKGVYEIDLTSADFDTVIDGVYDSEGNYIYNTYNDDGGEGLNSRVYLDVEESGDYYIAVRAFADYGIGDYSVSVTKQTDNEADNQNTTAISQIGNPYNGNIDYGYDVDWIKIIGLTSGETYTVTMTGNTLSDTVIDGIYDDNLQLIPNTYNDDYGYTLNSQVTFTASSDIVYVEVSGYGDNTGSYTLSVTPSTQDNSTDDNDTFETAESINVGDTIEASISPENDVDYYQIDLIGGNEYEFDVLGFSSGEGTLTDSTLTLYDENHNVIDYNDDYNGLDSTIIFTPDSDGTYYLAVESYANEYEGSYELATYQLNSNTEIQPINTNDTQNSTTIMIYIDADNNLESYALSDLEEMIEGDLPNNVNVTFLLDRANGYDSSFGDWSDAKYGLISGGSNYDNLSDIPMQDIGEVNMGDSQTLVDFINWSSNIAPADNYALVIWDHGGINADGNISGVASDEDSADYLTLDEIHQALSQTSVVQNEKLGVLGFDACLEATTDTFNTLKDDTDYIVASQATEPGDGWDYENWFNLIYTSNNDGDLTSQEIAQDAVESYGNYYQDYFMQATLSAIDTSYMSQFNDDFKAFNDSLVNLDDNTKNQIKAIFNSDVTKFEDEYFDLGDFINELANNNISITDSNGNDLVAQLQTDINNLVIEEQNNIEVSGVNDNDVTGINVYYPGYNDSNYLSNDFAQNVDLDHLYDLLLS